MSLGRHDPNATPIVPPAVYQKTATDIQRAREYLNAVEQRNEAGRANFDQLEREELELQKQIDEGMDAYRRLLVVQQQKASLEASSSRLIANQPATASRIEEAGSGNQPPPGIISLGDSVPIMSTTSQDFQLGSSTHQASYIHAHTANVAGNNQSRPTGYYAAPPHNNHASGPSLPTRQYNPMAPVNTYPRQNQVPHISRVSSGHEEFKAGPSNHYRSTGFQATVPPATSTQSVRHPTLSSMGPNYTQPSVPIASMHQFQSVLAASQPPFDTEHPQQHMYHPSHAAKAGSSITSSSLANALGKTSTNPSYVPPLSNNLSTPNFASPSAQTSATEPIREHAPSQQPVPSPAPTSSSSSASQPNQGVSAGQRSDLRTASQEPIPLPRDPTPENIFAIRKHFKGWAEKASVDPTNTNNHFFLFDWKVSSVRDSDQNIQIVMVMKERTLRFTLDEFLDRFIEAVYPQKRAAGPSSSAAQPSQPVYNKAQNVSPAPSAPTAVASAPVPPVSAAAPLDAIQNPSIPSPTTPVLTPSSIPNTAPSKVTLTSPRQANLKSLAKDILYGLGKKRPREPSMLSENAAKPVKKHASEVTVQASRTLELVTSPSEVSTAPLDKPPAPLSQEAPPDVSKQASNASASLEGLTIAGPSATPSFPVPTPIRVVDPKSTSSHSSVPRPSAETLRVIEYIPKVPESANIRISEFGSTSAPTISQPPITIVPSSSSSTQTSSRPGARASPVIDLTSPPTLGAMASTSKPPAPRSPEPLFLPSSSPEPQSPPTTLKTLDNFDLIEVQSVKTPESGIMKSKKTVKGKRDNVYVLVPPAPEYLVRYREQIRKKVAKGIPVDSQEVTVQELKRGKWTSSVSTSASLVEEEDFTYALEAQHLSPQDKDEREAVQLACTRLQEVPCRWNGCDCKLNSVESLIRHLNQHKPIPAQYTKSFMCRWTQCGQQVRFEDRHLERHAILPLRCPYFDCDDSFRSAARLLKHYRLKHKNGVSKPSYKPSPPKSLPLQPLPDNGIVPSYLLVTDLVKGKVISRERHETVGRWVAHNITTSGVQSRSRPRKVKSAQSSNQDAADAKNDYEFLTTRTTRYSTYVSTPVDLDLADLDSANISRMIDEEDFILWDSEGADEGGADGSARSPPDSPLFSSRVASGRIEQIKLETEDGPSVDTSRKPHDEEGSSDDDENAAVEIMLTDMSLTS